MDADCVCVNFSTDSESSTVAVKVVDGVVVEAALARTTTTPTAGGLMSTENNSSSRNELLSVLQKCDESIDDRTFFLVFMWESEATAQEKEYLRNDLLFLFVEIKRESMSTVAVGRRKGRHFELQHGVVLQT